MFNEPDLSGVHDTALGAGLMRGIHLLNDDEPKIFSDPYAIPLLGWPEERVLDLALSGSVRSTATWVSRSRFAEDRLVEARSRGVSQYVVLGAGLDSFALRHAETLGNLVVYEVDDPPMQAWKRRRIEQLNLPLPRRCASFLVTLRPLRFRRPLPEPGSWARREPSCRGWASLST